MLLTKYFVTIFLTTYHLKDSVHLEEQLRLSGVYKGLYILMDANKNEWPNLLFFVRFVKSQRRSRFESEGIPAQKSVNEIVDL